MGWFSDLQDAWKDVWHGIQDIPVVGDVLTGVQENITRPVYDSASTGISQLGNTLAKTKVDNIIAGLVPGLQWWNMVEPVIEKKPLDLALAAAPYIANNFSSFPTSMEELGTGVSKTLESMGFSGGDTSLSNLFKNWGTSQEFNPAGSVYGQNMSIPGGASTTQNYLDSSGVLDNSFNFGTNSTASALDATQSPVFSSPTAASLGGQTPIDTDPLSQFDWNTGQMPQSQPPAIEGIGTDSGIGTTESGGYYGGISPQQPKLPGMGEGMGVQGTSPVGAYGEAATQKGTNMGLGDLFDAGLDYAKKNPMEILGGGLKLGAGILGDINAKKDFERRQALLQQGLEQSDVNKGAREFATNEWMNTQRNPLYGVEGYMQGMAPQLKAAAAKAAAGGRRSSQLPFLMSNAMQGYASDQNKRLAAMNPAQFGNPGTSSLYAASMGLKNPGNSNLFAAVGDIYNRSRLNDIFNILNKNEQSGGGVFNGVSA